jgi:predicted N-acyltransferase
METKIINTIHDVAKDSWNDFTRGPLMSYEWFAYVEKIKAACLEPFYIICYEGDRIKGVLPTFCPMTWDNVFNDFIFGRFQRFFNPLNILGGKILLCYSPLSSGDIFWGRHIDMSTGELLIERLEELAIHKKISIIAFLHVQETSKSEIKWLESKCYKKVFMNSVGIIEGKYSGFDEYLLSLSPVKRKAVKQDIRKFNQSGLVLTSEDYSLQLVNKIHSLLMNVNRKHNYQPRHTNKHLLALSFDYMQNYLNTFVVRKRGKIIATHTIIEKDGIIESFALGLDYAELGDSRSYFYVFFYNTIYEMVKKKAHYINFYRMAYKTKERRGCRTTKQYMLVRSMTNSIFIKKWFSLVNRRYQKKFEKIYTAGS